MTTPKLRLILSASFLATIHLCAQPANNNFANAITITGSSNTVSGSNVGATKESGEPNHDGFAGGKSVWWKWTAPSNGIDGVFVGLFSG